jgi:hypothetical protein
MPDFTSQNRSKNTPFQLFLQPFLHPEKRNDLIIRQSLDAEKRPSFRPPTRLA